ncbi:unnamed protein product [Albugo candida]|uniref:Uncharacterized protein n=1 Tax=Albugo candida TaxID=65357 RepID=A0A024GJE2_9STRA|nr:unnamed protein product [Albugo candida]|eukprot:CCI46995.1 unnamed protein product [Albugo candida]
MAFQKCFICLAPNHKVVLVSHEKKHLCCEGKVTYGSHFPYDQFLRQLSQSTRHLINTNSPVYSFWRRG